MQIYWQKNGWTTDWPRSGQFRVAGYDGKFDAVRNNNLENSWIVSSFGTIIVPEYSTDAFRPFFSYAFCVKTNLTFKSRIHSKSFIGNCLNIFTEQTFI